MVIEGEASGRYSYHEIGALRDGISALKKKKISQDLPSAFHHIRTQGKVCDPAESPHPTMLAPQPHTSSL